MASITLVHPEEQRQLPALQAINKCTLFQNNVALLASPYVIRSSVPLTVFRQFVSSLEGHSVEITASNFHFLSQLSNEFGFQTLTVQLLAFQPPVDASVDPQALARIAVLEEQLQQRDVQVASFQTELLRESQFNKVVLSRIEAAIGELSREIAALRSASEAGQKDIQSLRGAIDGLGARLSASAAESQRLAGTAVQIAQSQEPLVKSVKDDLGTVLAVSKVVLERNPWVDLGELQSMKHFNELRAAYPFTKFQWGIDYLHTGPQPVTVCEWNRGIRIFGTLAAHGDNGGQLHLGTYLFTCETADPESQTGFYHRYVNHLLAPCCGAHGVSPSYGGGGNQVHIWTRYL
jgi:hypothetical protein